MLVARTLYCVFSELIENFKVVVIVTKGIGFSSA